MAVRLLRSPTLGKQVMFLIAVLLLLPVFLTLYMLHIIRNSELALLEYQKAKLSRAVDELDGSFQGSFQGSFKEILQKKDTLDKPKAEQVRILNEVLSNHIGKVSRHYPRVDMGFYSIDLDVILDGSENYEENFSRRRKVLFQEALLQQHLVVKTIGHSSAGLLETYKPFYRNGKLEGIVWASEDMAQTNFYKKVKQLEKNCYLIIVIGAVIGLGSAMLLIHNFVRNVDRIKKGVKMLGYDLYQKLPEPPGELGEISQAINKLAGKLIEVNKYNENMLSTIDDGLVVINAPGKVIIANHAAVNLLSLNSAWQERDYREAFPPESPFIELLSAALGKHEQYKDLIIPCSSTAGGTRQLLASISIMPGDTGAIFGAVLCCRDITERIYLEERANQQERLASLGKVVAGVAHEIRNPLTSISCYIQLWQKTHSPSPKSIKTIHEEVTRLESLVAQLLYFAKPAEVQFAPCDINQLVEKVLQFFTDIHLARFKIITEPGEELPRALIDPEQIERVLMNVIFNACQAMSEGGALKIRTSYDALENTVVVSISDTGCGISEEDLKRLFDPFFSTREKGTGLGLAIAHEIIQAHGGQIKVESRVGEGTTFHICLQAKREEA